MKRSVYLLAAISIILIFALTRDWSKLSPKSPTGDGTSLEEMTPAVQNPPANLPAQAAALTSPRNPPGSKPMRATSAEIENAKEPAAMVFFPGARVISKIIEPSDANGRVRLVETIETPSFDGLVRIERTLVGDRSGGLNVVEETAMTANQILLKRPRSITDTDFVEELRDAGALEVKPMGATYLATFEPRPQDPLALDGYISQVRRLSANKLIIEPNYIRRMF